MDVGAWIKLYYFPQITIVKGLRVDKMQIQVKGYLTYRELVGTRTVEIDAQPVTLRECLQVLEDEIGGIFGAQVLDAQSGGVQTHIALLLNGQHYRHLPKGLDTQVQAGDQLAFFPPIAGG